MGGPQINHPQLLAAGAIDFNMGSNCFSALNYVKNNIPMVCVGTVFQKDPQVLIAHAGQGNDSLAAMKGKPIMISPVARAGYWQFLRVKYGYADEQIRRLCHEAVARGWSHFKIKVGRDLQDDLRRAAIVRREIVPDRKLMLDANQVWDVGEAIASMRELARFDPWWIEEPTSPDDVLGHAAIARAVAPIGVATGEQCHNRVMFKQLMQAGAIRFCQIDSCRLGGVNEVLAVLLLAAQFGIPVCPHAGGVGLCEYVQHLAVFDYICVSASLDDRVVEYVDHLHEHFVDPVVVRDGRYVVPTAPGYSITMRPETLARYAYPGGPAWSSPR